MVPLGGRCGSARLPSPLGELMLNSPGLAGGPEPGGLGVVLEADRGFLLERAALGCGDSWGSCGGWCWGSDRSSCCYGASQGTGEFDADALGFMGLAF